MRQTKHVLTHFPIQCFININILLGVFDISAFFHAAKNLNVLFYILAHPVCASSIGILN
jgi:hypothetical protein